MPLTTRIRTPEEQTTFRRRCLRAAAAVGVAALAGAVFIGGPALAAHPEVSLSGSEFEIDTDANLKVDDPAPPSLDWANVAETRQPDEPSGAADDSFGQGSKEDTAVPTVVDGSIPPNKSDLLNFGVYLEEAAAGDFLHLFWHRVQEPSGTTNMDFEFNQSETLSGNGVTPVRTAGDLLIQYDLAQGGTNPELFLSYWVETGPKSLCEAANSTPCWGVRESLTAAGDATGSINTTAIPVAESDGLATTDPVSPRTFGEASVDFSAIVGDDCVGFGSAYLKSRSSDSFTAALKDFIAPTPVDLDRCGAIRIEKTKKHAADGPGDHPHADVDFTITGGDLPAAGEVVTTDADGVACLEGLNPGDYTVTESVPTGYAVSSANPQTATVVEDTTCETATPVTFANVPLTNITVSVDSQIPGGTASTIDCDGAPPFDATTDPVTGDGSLTLNNLQPGTYTCEIVVDP